MRLRPALTILAFTGMAFAAATSLFATSSLASESVAPSVRIVEPVSDARLTTLRANVHPLAQARFDQGAAPASMATGRMMLLLRRSDVQETALRHYLDELQNPSSPNYRKWLTPETLGKSYGVSDQDLASVKGWLESRGLHVESVPAARNLIVFSGTVGALQTTFHTSIHTYQVQGEKHFANAVDPQIPTALAQVVAGVSPMNDFRAKPQHHMGPRGVYDAESKRIKPQLTLQGCGNSSNPCNDVINYLYVVPSDAATIYDTPVTTLNAHYAATHNWDGSGITIGIVGYSNIPSADVLNYRKAFLNDADPAHLPTVIVDGNDPGVLQGGYADEALLDTEISGGLAPGASINYYTAETTVLQDGLGLAILRALDDNNVNILSASYGNCEAALGASGNYQFLSFWEQAAAQGITVTVSTGDNGSASCDDPNSETLASGGLAVSGLASTPFNIAVGGLDFAVLGTGFNNYVTTTSSGAPPYYETALGYIPEVPWNDSVVTDGTVAANVAYKDSSGNTNIVAGSGGKSSVAYCAAGNAADGSCPGPLSGYPKPGFQSSLTSNDGVRDIPDVSFFASNGAYNAVWTFCSDNVTNGDTTATYTDCQTSSTGVLTSDTSFGGIGGTSASTPAFAGMLALVAQSQGGIRLGQAANVLYNLAANHYGAVFHDTTVGNNSVPCSANSSDCGSNGFVTGYDTATGYDYASGLGSVDATALVANWSLAAFTATNTALTAGTSSSSLSTAAISIQHGTPVTFNVAVTPTSATGDVSVTNTSGVLNSAASYNDDATLGSNGTVQFQTNDLPGGTYTISAYYGGNATDATSTSSPISVNVSSETSTTALSIDIVDPLGNGGITTGATMPYGFYSSADVQPYGNRSTTSNGNIYPDGVPTGNISLTVNGAVSTLALNSIGAAEYSLSNQAPGNYTFQASYAGDTSFQPSTSPSKALTITKAGTGFTLTPSATTVAASGSVSVVVALTTDSVGAVPTGAITLTGHGTSFSAVSSETQSGFLANGTVAVLETFTVPGSQLASGLNTLTASYAGDANYNSTSATTSVTVSGTATGAAFTVVGPSGGITISAPGQSGTGTITLAPTNGFTGAISLTCSVAAASSGVTPSCSIPQTATISGTAAATAVLTVSTTASTSANELPLRRFFSAGGEVALGCLVLLAVPARRRSWRSMVALLVVIVGAGVIGCGGTSGTSTKVGTNPGNYTVTVTGTSGSATANTQVTVVVQ